MELITDKRMANGFINPNYTKFLLNKIEESPISQSEADELQQTLLEGIKKYPGIGLSASQLGINKRACIILNSLTKEDNADYLFLVNPVMINKSDEYFIFWESCLSLPKTLKKPIRTYRHSEITIKTDNLGELTFKINPAGDAEAPEPFKVSLETLQTAIVQHEIDHLDGITIRDRNSLNWTQRKAPTYGRNDKIVMKAPSGELVEVKFKKANEYFLKGYEIV